MPEHPYSTHFSTTKFYVTNQQGLLNRISDREIHEGYIAIRLSNNWIHYYYDTMTTTMKRWEREYDDNDDNKDIWEGQFVWVGVITVPTSSIKPWHQWPRLEFFVFRFFVFVFVYLLKFKPGPIYYGDLCWHTWGCKDK